MLKALVLINKELCIVKSSHQNNLKKNWYFKAFVSKERALAMMSQKVKVAGVNKSLRVYEALLYI